MFAAGACAVALVSAMPDEARAQLAGVADSADDVTYQDVLQRPNDIDLNIRYARQQMAAGNLAAAASALERILINVPDAHRVRLLYGILLYRLDQMGEALQELEAVDPEYLSPENRQKLARFRRRAERAQQQVRGDVGVTAGVHFDSNRNGFPDDGRFQVDLPGAGPTTFESTDSENADIGRFVMVDGRVDIATDWQRLPRVTVEGTGLVDDQVEEDDLDTVSGRARLSTVYEADLFDALPRVSVDSIRLGGEPYLTSGAARLRLQRALGADERLIGFVDGEIGYEDFSDVDRAPFADEQDGPIVRAGGGLRYTPVDRLTLEGRYLFTDKQADEAFESYQSHYLGVETRLVATPGVYLSAQASYAYRKYDAPDPFVSRTNIREDDAFEVGAGVGITADRIARMTGLDLPDILRDNLIFSVNGSYRTVQSNQPNFEHDNLRIEFAVTKRFLF